jgi:hypothetical protein
VPTFLLAVLLLQDVRCPGNAARHVSEALRLGESFDLSGAAAAYAAAERSGCESAAAAAIYVRGLIAARAADASFASAASLLPVQLAVASLDPLAAKDPVARAMQAVLRTAIPAAQHERPEMELRIEEMLRMESLQLEAKLPPLPVLSAHEVAGYFWLQLHLYDEARHAFDEAARRIGRTPHILLGAARAFVGRRDPAAACEQYRQLISWWGSRPGSPMEITEAREYIKQPQCAAATQRPGARP